jgi:1-deoxy-D-xylulose-5-phosphate reductoisomerase
LRRKISIFGATGSVGQQTVELIERQGGAEVYDVVALTGATNVDLLAEQARRLGASLAVTADKACLDDLKNALKGTETEALSGVDGLREAANRQTDWTMSAIVGVAGLEPTLVAAANTEVIALANKESLVCAGALLKRICAKHGTTLLPVDSEHSAIFQALRGERPEEIERLILTASGGPFRDWPLEKMAGATPQQAASHPNWDMGVRISIDSATMFNKAMEMIEAHELFDVDPSMIEVIVHPQSTIHSMIGFRDGSIIAQMGPPDMRGAIGYALNWPHREDLPVERVDFAALSRLDFHAVAHDRFPAIGLAERTMQAGGLAGAAFNAAKECALDAFVNGEIGFLDMASLVDDMLRNRPEDRQKPATGFRDSYGLEDVLAVDAQVRRAGREWIEARSRKAQGMRTA